MCIRDKTSTLRLTPASNPAHSYPALMPHTKPESLSRRERQIMDILWRAGRATASEIHAHLADAPSYSAVRALLAILVEKGHLRYERDGKRYVYEPVSYTHLRAHETPEHLVCRLLLEK